MINADSRFPIRNGGAYRIDSTIKGKDRVNEILARAQRPKPDVLQTK